VVAWEEAEKQAQAWRAAKWQLVRWWRLQASAWVRRSGHKYQDVPETHEPAARLSYRSESFEVSRLEGVSSPFRFDGVNTVPVEGQNEINLSLCFVPPIVDPRQM